MNPHASHHLGYVDYDGSQTPIGVNLFGVAFEDANYAVAERGTHALDCFTQSVCDRIKRGRSSGIHEGKKWKLVLETEWPPEDLLWRIANHAKQGLITDGSRHKQWFLSLILQEIEPDTADQGVEP